MTIYLTDGPRLKLVVGSNTFNLGIDPERLNTDIMVFFSEAGQSD